MFGFFRRPAAAVHPLIVGMSALVASMRPLPVDHTSTEPGGWMRQHYGSGHRDGHKGEQVKRRARNRRRNKLAKITKRQMRAKARR